MSTIREEPDFANHEAGHSVIARMLRLDPVKFVTIIPKGTMIGHTNFEKLSSIETKEHAIRQGLMYCAGLAAENAITWNGGLGGLLNGDDATQLNQLASDFFSESENQRITYLGRCWKEANALMTPNVLATIKVVARELLAKKRLTGDELDQICVKLPLDSSRYDAAVERILAACAKAAVEPAN